MTLRRQRQHELRLRVLPAGVAIVGQLRGGMSRHRNFRNVRAGASGNVENSAMPYWPGNSPKPSASPPPADPAVVVESRIRRHAGVRWRGERVSEGERSCAVLRHRQVVAWKLAATIAIRVVVELLQQQDVGPHALDDLRHRARLTSSGVASARKRPP
jgi:hypothetical protein